MVALLHGTSPSCDIRCSRKSSVIALSTFLFFILPKHFASILTACKMVSEWVAPIVITSIWAFIGIICPFFARGPNRGVTQCCLMLTAATCWLFWLCCYMTQLNPLIGPKLSMNEIMIMAREWGNEIKNTMDVTV